MNEEHAQMLMTLRELAQLAGLSLETLTDYERVGLIRPVSIGSESLYGSDARLRLEVVAKARRLGFTLDEIKRLIEAGTRSRVKEGRGPSSDDATE